MATEYLTQGELDGIRLDVAQIFKDACTITREPAGDAKYGTLNKATSEYESVPAPTVIRSGNCLIKPIISRRDRFDEFGEGLVFTRQYRVAIPYSWDDIQIRDIFTATASQDSQLVGREMRVRDVIVGTDIGYRRLTVQDVRE